MTKFVLPLLLLLLLASSAFAQQTGTLPPTSRAATNAEARRRHVVRITTNLVQVDAVVTDNKGKLVTDLKPEEIEIFEDGRSRKSHTSR